MPPSGGGRRHAHERISSRGKSRFARTTDAKEEANALSSAPISISHVVAAAARRVNRIGAKQNASRSGERCYGSLGASVCRRPVPQPRPRPLPASERVRRRRLCYSMQEMLRSDSVANEPSIREHHQTFTVRAYFERQKSNLKHNLVRFIVRVSADYRLCNSSLTGAVCDLSIN